MSPARRSGPFAACLAALILVATAPSLRGDPVHATAYEIDARFNPAEGFLEASTVITLGEAKNASNVGRFWLHGELRVSEVTSAGRALEFSQNREFYRRDYALVGNRVEVTFPEGRVPDRIEVKWAGYFHASKARSPSDYMRVDESGIFLRALGYSPWFPLFLEQEEDEYDVDFGRVSITVPSAMTAVFAGTLVSSENQNDETRFTWRADSLPLFAAQVTARPFVVTSEERVSIYSLGDEGSLSAAKKVVDLTRSLLDYYRTHYSPRAVPGPVHIVEMPEYGDISSGNVVGIQEKRWRSISESEGAKLTLAHELVHPFVQPTISRSDPLYALVIESFPSYFHFAALDSLGEMDYRDRISRIRTSYLKKRETGKGWRGRDLPEEKPISKIGPDEIGAYKDTFILSDRAVLFLHELRTRMGKSRFDVFARALFAKERVDDKGFRTLVLEYLPDFEEQLTVWLDGIELPEMEDES